MKKFALKVSVWNAIGYAVSVGIPTVVDPMLEHHVKYGARTYPLEYWIFLPSIIILGLTYFVNIKNWSAVTKGCLALIILVVPTWATLGNFLPEFPHANVLFGPIWFGALVALTVYVRNHKINFDFIHDDKIDRLIKIESIKMEHDAWFRILIGLLAVYGLGLIYIYMYVKDFMVVITPSAAEQMTLLVALTVAVVLNVLLFLTGFVWEMLARIREIRGNLLNVR